jgi:hypothetical protein
MCLSVCRGCIAYTSLKADFSPWPWNHDSSVHFAGTFTTCGRRLGGRALDPWCAINKVSVENLAVLLVSPCGAEVDRTAAQLDLTPQSSLGACVEAPDRRASSGGTELLTGNTPNC